MSAEIAPVDRSPDGTVAWVERNTKLALNDDQARCVEVLCSFVRPYNLQLIGDRWQGAVTFGSAPDPEWDGDLPPVLAPVEFGNNWVTVYVTGDLATYDFAELTRLVAAAHRRAVRVQVSAELYRAVDDCAEPPYPYPAACLRIGLHARRRFEDGDHSWDFHPTIEEAFPCGRPHLDEARSGAGAES